MTDDVIIETTTTRTIRRSSNVTHVALLIDESESMLGSKAQTLSAVNEYLSTLRSQKIDYRVTLSMFNSVRGCRVLYADRPIVDVHQITADLYAPSGT